MTDCTSKFVMAISSPAAIAGLRTFDTVRPRIPVSRSHDILTFQTSAKQLRHYLAFHNSDSTADRLCLNDLFSHQFGTGKVLEVCKSQRFTSSLVHFETAAMLTLCHCASGSADHMLYALMRCRVTANTRGPFDSATYFACCQRSHGLHLLRSARHIRQSPHF